MSPRSQSNRVTNSVPTSNKGGNSKAFNAYGDTEDYHRDNINISTHDMVSKVVDKVSPSKKA